MDLCMYVCLCVCGCVCVCIHVVITWSASVRPTSMYMCLYTCVYCTHKHIHTYKHTHRYRHMTFSFRCSLIKEWTSVRYKVTRTYKHTYPHTNTTNTYRHAYFIQTWPQLHVQGLLPWCRASLLQITYTYTWKVRTYIHTLFSLGESLTCTGNVNVTKLHTHIHTCIHNSHLASAWCMQGTLTLQSYMHTYTHAYSILTWWKLDVYGGRLRCKVTRNRIKPSVSISRVYIGVEMLTEGEV
jgi:hypothetical protein